MKRLYFIVLTFLAVHLSYGQSNACKDILVSGVKDYLNFTNSEDFDSQFDNWVNSQQFNDFVRNSSNGFNLSLPIPDFPLSLGSNSNNESINRFKNIYQTGLNIENRRIVRQNLVHAVANQDVVEAWSQCMAGNNNVGGLQTYIEDDPNSLLINFGIKWASSMNIHSAEIQSIDIIGGTISGDCITKDTFVGSEWINCIIRKSSVSEEIAITIRLKNNLGSKVLQLKSQSQQDNRSTLEKCFAGDLNACNQILQSTALNDKMMEDGAAKWRACEIIASPQEKERCLSEAASTYDRHLQEMGTFYQLIRSVMDTYTGCSPSGVQSNSCKQRFAQMNDAIYRYVNQVPSELNHVYSVTFNY